MFELRKQGYDWAEIAQLLNTTHHAARAEFSREVRRLKVKFANPKRQADSGTIEIKMRGYGAAKGWEKV